MPIHVTLALEGRQMVIPFRSDNMLEDDSDSSLTMSVVAIEREVRKVLPLSAYAELVFIPNGETFPLRTAASDESTLNLVIAPGREDYHERNLFNALQEIDEKDSPHALVSLKACYARRPDDNMPDGWRYYSHQPL